MAHVAARRGDQYGGVGEIAGSGGTLTAGWFESKFGFSRVHCDRTLPESKSWLAPTNVTHNSLPDRNNLIHCDEQDTVTDSFLNPVSPSSSIGTCSTLRPACIQQPSLYQISLSSDSSTQIKCVTMHACSRHWQTKLRLRCPSQHVRMLTTLKRHHGHSIPLMLVFVWVC